MEPRAAAAAPPRSRQRARRTPHDPAAPIAVASGSLGILALGGGTTRVQFALATGSVLVPLHSFPLVAHAAAAAGAAPDAQGLAAELRRRSMRATAPSRIKMPQP